MKYQYLMFDLDGTLTDPAEGITGGVLYALERFGIQEEDRKKLCDFIGPPLTDSFHKHYGFSPEQGDLAVQYYREYYGKQGKFENVPYEGVKGMLESLRASGKKLFVATSKGENFAKEILDHFELTPYFDGTAGQPLDSRNTRKSDLIKRLLAEFAIADLDHTVMVGDREHDVIAARESGVHSIGVLYGYGSREELLQAGAEQIVKDVPALGQALLA